MILAWPLQPGISITEGDFCWTTAPSKPEEAKSKAKDSKDSKAAKANGTKELTNGTAAIKTIENGQEAIPEGEKAQVAEPADDGHADEDGVVIVNGAAGPEKGSGTSAVAPFTAAKDAEDAEGKHLQHS